MPSHNSKALAPIVIQYNNGGSLTNFVQNESAKILTLCAYIETCDLHIPQASTSLTADINAHLQDNSTTDMTDVSYNICMYDD
jgi:hypothetical protein